MVGFPPLEIDTAWATTFCAAGEAGRDDLGRDEFRDTPEVLRRDHGRMVLRVGALERAHVSW